MKLVFKSVFFILVISSLLFATSCEYNASTENPSLNVSEVILPFDDQSETFESSNISSNTQSVFEESEKTFSDVSSSPTSSSTTSSQPIPPATYEGDWNLILVNSYNLLPADFTVTIENIGNRPMDQRIVSVTKQMIADAKADGVDLLICSSYRSVERQETLFENQIQEFLNLGYNYEEAKKEASTWVAIPGTSEHHTGLALDIVTPTYQVLDFGFEETTAFKWLSTHCTEYGFILRYPKDKTDITGIVYEPWHYRYVGVEAAKYIHDNGLCLEEYIEQINK